MLTKDFILTKIFIIIVTICLTQFFSKNCFAIEPDEILLDRNRSNNI